MVIDFYGMRIEVWDEQGRMAKIGSEVDHWELEMAHEFLSRGDRCLVAGGGRGSVATWVATKLGPENTVVFEMIPDLCRMMEENIRFDTGPFPHLFWGALGTENQQVRKAPVLFSGNNVTDINANPNMITVPEVDINDVIRDFKINSLNLDIEGDEYSILPHLNTDPLRLISMELHGPVDKGTQARLYLASKGFQCVFWLEHTSQDNSYQLQHMTMRKG